jgi:4'-phosphopantetheinyl transferase
VRLPTKELQLSADVVHLWELSLDCLSSTALDKFNSVLSPCEKLRAGRFAFDRDRERFVARRGALRTILGLFCGLPANKLEFRHGRHGKPCLADDFNDHAIRFNSSHSDGLMLCAVNSGREVGVDVERIRAIREADQIAARFFSRREYAAFTVLPPSEKYSAFFSWWTCKEAYLKARGTGLIDALNELDVSVNPGQPSGLLNISGNSREASEWSLRSLTIASGFASALAVEASDWRLKRWRWRLNVPELNGDAETVLSEC